MVFSDEQIEQFRQLYFKRYGIEISKEDAYEQATKLVHLLLLIYKPMAVEDYEATQKQRLEMLPDLLRHIASQEKDGDVQ